MKPPTSDIAFTPTVKAIQERLGSRHTYASMEQRGSWSRTVTGDLEAFIAERDTLFLGTVNADGQPYIQHRGGPPGFLKVLDDRTLAFADFPGNRQYISMGNLDDNDRAFLFLIDFAHRQRVKLWGRAEVVEDDPGLLARLTDGEYGVTPERAFLFHLDAWDRNCPQHITPRFTREEFEPELRQLRQANEALKTQVEELTARIAAAGLPE